MCFRRKRRKNAASGVWDMRGESEANGHDDIDDIYVAILNGQIVDVLRESKSLSGSSASVINDTVRGWLNSGRDVRCVSGRALEELNAQKEASDIAEALVRATKPVLDQNLFGPKDIIELQFIERRINVAIADLFAFCIVAIAFAYLDWPMSSIMFAMWIGSGILGMYVVKCILLKRKKRFSAAMDEAISRAGFKARVKNVRLEDCS